MIKKYYIIIFLILGCIFLISPKLDISLTQAFYHEHLDFIYRDNSSVVILSAAAPIATVTYGLVTILTLCYNAYYKRNVLLSKATYLLLALTLGPGLLINFILKDHFGRARPKEVLEFGGNKAFTSPLYVSDQCDSNCSFSSGHAAVGYYNTALSYIIPLQYQGVVFLLSIVLGTSIGFARVLQGANFPSDTVFSGIFIMLTNHLCFIGWKKFTRKIKPVTKKKKKK